MDRFIFMPKKIRAPRVANVRRNVRPRSKETFHRNVSTIHSALLQLQHAELVRVSHYDAQEYFFKHALVQDTALSTLLRGEYKRLNMLVARALEQVNATRLDEYAAQLAQHYDAAGDDAKTLEYATRAGDKAMRVSANVEAIAFYAQALEAAKRGGATTAQWIHLYAQRGRAYELNAQYDAALLNYDELEELGHARGERAFALAALMARLPIFATPTPKYNPAQAELLADQALLLARELGDRAAEAKTLWLRMLTMVRSMRPQNGIADGEAALVLARELNLREQLAYTLHDLGSAYFGMGHYERARELGRQTRELWRELDNKPMLADNLSLTANGLVFLGEFEQAIQLSDEAFHICHAIGNLWGQAWSLMMMGLAHAERGDYARALTGMQDCIRYAEQAGFFVPQVQTRAMLAQIYFQLGAWEHAKKVGQQVLTIQNTTTVHPIAIPLRVRLYLIMGELTEADALLARAYMQFKQTNEPPNFFQSIVMVADVQLGMARGEYARVLPLLDTLIQNMRALGVKFFLPEMAFYKGQALLELGERDAAYTALLEADAHAHAIGSRRMRWQILAGLYEIERARGNFYEAENFRAEAHAILEYIVAHTPEELREGFLNLPKVRAAYFHENREQA